MTDKPIYDYIGEGYAVHRRSDPRIASEINRALGDVESVINVGAGAGSYEPQDRDVVAVEPSRTMIDQRANGSAPVIRALAANLPFGDSTFDAGLAILTIHHWDNRRLGLQELVRVVRGRIVIVTFDPESSGFWLVEDYFPEIREIDRQTLPSIEELCDLLGEIAVHPLLVPHDCVDGFLGAYWRRPHMYLDEHVRQVISSFTKIRNVESGVNRLRRDLANGTWQERHRYLLKETQIDVGYRLVIRP